MTEPASVPQRSMVGEFRLDLPAAHEAVTALEAVKEKLTTLRFDAAEVARQAAEQPQVFDLISREAFSLLSLKADGGPDSLASALQAGIEHVEALIAQMNHDIDEQERLDESAERELRA